MFKKSLPLLILSNFVPVVGVLFFKWSVAAILLAFWTENLVVGFYNVLKMKGAQGTASARGNASAKTVTEKNKGCMIPFFVMHYGCFTLVHGVFVLTFFKGQSFSIAGMIAMMISLFISHGISFQQHFIRNKEYLRVRADSLFIQPYKRLVIMHLTIIFGGMFITSMKTPYPALFILIGLKITIDAFSHIWEHRKFLK